MANARWFYDGIKAKGVSWDITALSYYCVWHGSLSNLTSVIADMRPATASRSSSSRRRTRSPPPTPTASRTR